MDALRRRTLARAVEFEGSGVHTGEACALRIEPAEAGHGIVLENARHKFRCPATLEFADAEASERRTVLAHPDGGRFEQMEHMMAALAAAGVSDALVVQDGLEPPFMDGGCYEFLKRIRKTGTVELDAAWPALEIEEPLMFQDGGALMTAAPGDRCSLSAFVEFPGTVVGSSGAMVTLGEDDFEKEVSKARTFVLAREVEMLRAAGYGKGATLSNTVVFDGEKFHNGRLNYPNEPARHKLIDLLGDLALLGCPLRGHVGAWRAGHRSHVRFARFLAESLSLPR
ncbi:MAG: UDP-3-O-acyl-N-acetylglucosamine deacetylase [Candidatus Sumerlaeia bacterium]|nr:UDP-3-O-acyl-N-acetylglucosamine deacetylase [Candidatus Sumerlaeia bacterium]